MNHSPDWQIRIDTGGTFTDCIGRDPQGVTHRCKVLSSGALKGKVLRWSSDHELVAGQEWNAPDGFINGSGLTFAGRSETFRVVHFDAARSAIRLDRPHPFPPDHPGSAFQVHTGEEAPILGARLMTRTLPGQALPSIRMRLATTKGTNALLERKGSPVLFLITAGFGDLLRIGDQQRKDLFALQIQKTEPLSAQILEVPERIDTHGSVLRQLDLNGFGPRLDRMIGELKQQYGDELSAAVCLMNSYKNPIHEELLATFLEEKGIRRISVSSRLSGSVKIVPRSKTTEVNAYLDALMKRYLDRVTSGLDDPDLSIMTSSGGLVRPGRYQPKDGLLSGPACGVTGAASAARACGLHKVITFDMGGTSTDVSRYDNGFDYSEEHAVGDARISAPALSIETIAAGGGSICDFDGVSLTAGPASAGADPGPACYGSGGPLTITDVNLLAGRLSPANFHLPLDRDAARKAFHQILHKIRQKRGAITEAEILEGFLDIANEKMAQSIKTVSTVRGFDPAGYALVAFGGAGGQHATAVASKLGIEQILVPPDAGLLSAVGLERARLEKIESLQCLKKLSEVERELPGLIRSLEEKASASLLAEGVDRKRIGLASHTLFARLEGQESTLEVSWSQGISIQERFRKTYRERYGHWIDNKEIEIESIRVMAVEKTGQPQESHRIKTDGELPVPVEELRPILYQGRRLNVPVIQRSRLKPGTTFASPALILDPWSTLFAEPGWDLQVRTDSTLELTRNARPAGSIQQSDPVVQLQLYANRFSSVAEQMGEMLRRTALSVNIRERLDFSCAVLDRDGFLVANAQHIPVHLGAIGLCVRTLLGAVEMKEGDMILTNHPKFGGSHLPDLTLISPVYHNNRRIGFVANRAHHSEIGGMSPGSMPPDAGTLEEEGVVFPPFYLIRGGKGQWEQLEQRLRGAAWPSRAVRENLADLQAAVAANQLGASKLLELTRNFGESEVTGYMKQIKSWAASRTRQTLRKLGDGTWAARERLDDGSLLCVKCRIEGERLTVDFTGTAEVHPGNLNANPSIVNSVVIYVLRLLVNEPLPLNDGLLEPVEIILPSSTLLNPFFPDNPAECPAVVGGNIETSQRLVDTLLKAFEAAGCSQGTMNNILFGNPEFGYYETVAGGTGAGPGYHGADGVHHHMTNTRATDPEILEQRYPVRLERFAIRSGSGGKGKWNGGNGLVREFTFLEPLDLSVLTQHRTIPPYGLKGGQPGKTGRQTLVRKNGERIEFGWRGQARVGPGDRLLLETPGGGGYGG